MTAQDPTTDAASDAPEEAGAQSVPWARQPNPARRRTTSRARQIVETLPDWEPMPPGVAVRRPRQD
ncbi:hypothetical protein [Micromonospora sp. NPDC049175]|uniref:hypothetical protein n=1 Tax=unclassified Micromonospora TaxID=2617518 RepID=UPI003724B275